MIVDYIGIDKLPALVVWLDWIFYAHKFELLLCVVLVNVYQAYFSVDCLYRHHAYYTFGEFQIATFCGVCLWIVYIFIVEGHGIG